MTRLFCTLLFLFSLIQAALAGGCTLTECGHVENRSGRTLRFTTVLDFNCKKAQYDRCDVFNLKSTEGCSVPPPGNVRHVSCKQCDLASGRKAGRNGVDVDAITYANLAWRARGYTKANGDTERSWVNIPKGVWIRIHNTQKIVCTFNSGLNKPECVVSRDLVEDVGSKEQDIALQEVLMPDRVVRALASPTCASTKPL